MTIKISKKTTLEEFNKILSKLSQQSSTGFKANKYLGKLSSLKEDPLTIQKQMRNEWD